MRILLFALMWLGIPTSVWAEVELTRLTWAGIKLVHEDSTVFIDAVGRDLWGGNPPGGDLIPLEASTGRRYALVTHVHNDHFDVDSLRVVLGERGYVICHEDDATYVASRGLRVIPAKYWTPIRRGGFLFTAVPAVDGMGDTQVSWVITVDELRLFHGGDTLWHGGLDLVGAQFGPFDLAFLPVNGARVLRDPMPETPASLTPVQAIDAALMLRAETLIPIHYGLDNPPYYREVADAIPSLLDGARRRGVSVNVLDPGDSLRR